ncbi:aminoglycoside 6'-N-acetyltransferase [Rhizobium mesoamericanum]|uniref:Aminoglycoside N(6')-acetyltransferase type 1 n=1 Tax=Rhizobium mesoamericanum STM3625 TaxID=1211777 RepID=K0PYR4_9HYPH|nr:aminoglycoside 6'-N-acetyltransferase [Rhizobium mesoamericanum]CCM76910.1 GCN5-related N-acetyltransferase [Rhizobium mesoamericanum STM3625]
MRKEPGLPVATVRGCADHLREWSRLRAALWPSHSSGYHADELDTMIARNSDEMFGIVAPLPDGVLAGFAEACLRHDYVNGCSSSPVLFLEGIYVEPAYRRQGIGRALFDAVRSAGKALGCVEFASDASIDNIESHLFHRALGFEEAERVVFFRQSL